MARQYYKDSTTGQMKPIGVKVEDTLPVGTEVDYDGIDIPEGWEKISDVYETAEDILWTGDATGGNTEITLSKDIESERTYRFYIQSNDIKTLDIKGDVILNSSSSSEIAKSTDAVWCNINSLTLEAIRLYKKASNKLNISVTVSVKAGTGSSGTDNGSHIIKITEIYEKKTNNMRIRKKYQVIPTNAKLENGYSTSATNGYTADYINSLNEYSTDEVRIGTWTDGKPLYRKVYTGVSAKYALVTNQPTFNVVLFDGYIQNATNYGKYPIIGPHSTSNDYCFPYNEQNGDIRIHFSDDQSNEGKYNYTLIIYYTKTTD